MSNKQWSPVKENIWTGRDDLQESPIAKRLFQTITKAEYFTPEQYKEKIALLGFECDEGVKINKGRTGASKAPDALRKAMANLPAFTSHEKITDMGNINFSDNLDHSHAVFAEHVKECHKNNMYTFVLGGGHETAYAHGLGIYSAHKNKRIGIINFDAHLDIRTTSYASSGTPFKQLSEYCKKENRPFEYMCIGASYAANTAALIKTAEDLNVRIVWDMDCYEANMANIKKNLNSFIENVDIIYLTIDLDVIEPGSMYAVSAPAALGVNLRTILMTADIIAESSKLKGFDMVEYIPELDPNNICSRVAARLGWQICKNWR